MAIFYAYNFAQIDLETNMCVAIQTTTNPDHGNYPDMVEIPVYDEGYLFKYYINGVWYEDADGTIPWSPSV